MNFDKLNNYEKQFRISINLNQQSGPDVAFTIQGNLKPVLVTNKRV